MLPLVRRHMQVRQVPLRHDAARRMPARRAACSKGIDAGAANCSPAGCSVAMKLSLMSVGLFLNLEPSLTPRITSVHIRVRRAPQNRRVDRQALCLMRDFEDSTLWRVSAFERVQHDTGTSGFMRLEGPTML